MSWLFSQALVEEFSADTSSGGEPCAPLNVMPTPHKFWRNDKTMDCSDLSRFGLTCAVLTDDRGEELLMSYRAGFPARTSAPPEKETDSMERAPGSGANLRGWFATFDPGTSSWRTAQCSLLADSESFSGTWPRWGSMRNGASYLRPIPALHICASASGLWQTPVADDAIERTAGKWNSRGEPKLSAEVKLWPTPTASASTGAGHQGRMGGFNLQTAVAISQGRKWPTPMANDAEKRGAARVGACLPGAVEQSNESGLLNPTWVEWLMGWPIEWTELRPSETDKFREWQQQHGTCSVAAERITA